MVKRGDRPSACPNCGSKDFQHNYRNSYECNKCKEDFQWEWTDNWGDEEIYSFRSAISERDSDYQDYLLKTRSISINNGRCYFCNRSENDWKVIHTQIMDYLKTEKDSLGGDAGTRKMEIKSAVNSFNDIWSKVNSRHKVSTLMSDPHEFFPEEISKFWDEEWEEDGRNKPFSKYFPEYRYDEHPEWYSLERLCLEWLYRYHFDKDVLSSKKINKDVRVKSIQKQMLSEIKVTYEENFGRGDSGISVDEKIAAEKILLHRLQSLQEGKSGLRGFSWKPWSDDDILSGARSHYGDRRSDLLSINTWICPLCLDRFQSQDG